MTSQHWIANNLFGLAFALNGVELLHLNNVSTGCILLGGLFVYDVFWVSSPSFLCFSTSVQMEGISELVPVIGCLLFTRGSQSEAVSSAEGQHMMAIEPE